MGDLALALVQVLDLQPQQIAGGGEGEASAGGVVPEQGDAQTGLENLGGDVVLPHIAQSVGHGEDGLDFVVRLVPGEEEVPLVHLLKVEGIELVNVFLKSGVYSLSYLMLLSVLPARNWDTSAVLFSSR